MSALAMVARKSLMTNLMFSDRPFYVTIFDADIRNLKSLHTLFDEYLDHMLVKFEQNPRKSEPFKILSFLIKNGQQF